MHHKAVSRIDGLLHGIAFMCASYLAAAAFPAAVRANDITVENARAGNPPSEWEIDGAGDANIQGFATDISVNRGETVHFKIDTDATAYHIDIYRFGYYQGNGARKISQTPILPDASLPQVQPAALYDPVTAMTDCGNWAESAHWDVPADAVSGVYIAKLTRDDATAGTSHITFIVRDDASTSDFLFQTSDATWQAYNVYGGGSLYPALGGHAPGFNHATKVSYNRPFDIRNSAGGVGEAFFASEYPMIRWLEANGYDVTYTTCVDSDRRGNLIQQHRVFLSNGHDEYWSGPQRANVTAARDAGVHLGFFSGNEVYWKVRYEPSSDGTNTPYRTLVCYKEGSLGENGCGTKCDPSPEWTGLWRDGCAPGYNPATNGACLPENSLSGQIGWDGAIGAIQVPDTFKNLRFWRNTSIAQLGAGETATLGASTLGSEWDWEQFGATYPARRILLSTTVLNGRTHHLSLYRANSGALVFGAGTIQWCWGLDAVHQFPGPATNLDMQQATVNLFADMGASPETLQPGLIAATGSSDTQAPSSAITSPADGATAPLNSTVTIQGTATDAGGGSVAGVEVSVDGGLTWRAATGTSPWTFAWAPTVEGVVTIRSRAYDDTGNLETAGSGPPNVITVTVTTPVCPCTVFQPGDAPAGGVANDNTPEVGIEAGMKIRADVDGWITALRYYKPVGATGTHVGNLRTTSGASLASRSFTAETASGWQEVTLPTPVAITAGTTYVVSYFSPSGDYVGTNNYFTQLRGAGRVHGLQDGTDGPNGLYLYTSSTTLPTGSYLSSNYYADVVFVTSLAPDGTPPVISAVTATPNPDGTETISWTTDEASDSRVDYGTASNMLSLNAASATMTTIHALTLSGLSANTTYHYRVTSIDASTNSATSPAAPAPPATFATPQPPCFVDQVRADFALGSADAGIAIGGDAAGEVTLAPAVGSEFDGTTLPADWMQMDWDSPGTGTVVVAGGTVTVDGARFNPTSLTDYGPGVALDFVARYQGESFQGVGLGAGDNSLSGLMNIFPFATFSPGLGSSEVQARSGPAGGSQTITTLAGLTGAFHRYRIEWTVGSVKFYVDGGLMATHPGIGTTPMRPAITDYNLSGSGITVEWLRLSPYAAAGTFTSRVFDAGSTTSWGNALWTADVPVGTTLGVSVRTGPTPTPDGSWSSFAPLASGDAIGAGSRYMQYRAALATANSLLTPALGDFTATCAGVTDATPPSITNVVATPAGDGLSALVTWTTDEPADSRVDVGTDPDALTPGSLAASLVTSHSVTLTGLSTNTVYHYRVRSADAANNAALFPDPPAAPRSFNTTLFSECFADRTSADFSQGTTGSSTYVSETADGEVVLAPTVGAEFSGASLPAGWFTEQWQPPGGSITVSGGRATLNGYRTAPPGFSGPYGTVEMLATFTAETFQHLGFENLDASGGPYYAIFSTYNTTNQIWARSIGTDVAIPGSGAWIGSAHLYKLIWQPGSVEFWVDGVQRVTLTVSISTPMRPYFSDFGLGAEDLSVDWLRLSPYASSGTFTSRIVDSGTMTSWGTMSWSADVPAGTSLAMTVRTGDTPTPDGTWTSASIPSSGSAIGAAGRYIQYSAAFASNAGLDRTAELRDVSITCSACGAGAPSVITDLSSAATGNAGGGRANVRLTWSGMAPGETAAIYRKAFGDYPLYRTGPTYGGVPTAPAGPAAALGAGWQQTAVTASGGLDGAPMRGLWYFVAYVTNSCGQTSGPSNVTSGTLNYLLGDVSNGSAVCAAGGEAGDAIVNTPDMSALGGVYGQSFGPADDRACFDVGPTVDLGIRSRPAPDGLLSFDDLVIYALNFDVPFPAARADLTGAVKSAAEHDELSLVAPASVRAGERFDVMLRLRGGGSVHAVSSRLSWDAATAEVVGVAPGAMLAAAGGIVLSPRPGIVDAAVFGERSRGLSGDGELAVVTYRARRDGDPLVRISGTDARDGANRPVTLGATAPPAPPVVHTTQLGPVFPNPFRSSLNVMFTLARETRAIIVVYDLAGRAVRHVEDGVRPPGVHVSTWDGRGDAGQRVPAGMYVVQFEAGAFRQVRRVQLIR